MTGRIYTLKEYIDKLKKEKLVAEVICESDELEKKINGGTASE